MDVPLDAFLAENIAPFALGYTVALPFGFAIEARGKNPSWAHRAGTGLAIAGVDDYWEIQEKGEELSNALVNDPGYVSGTVAGLYAGKLIYNAVNDSIGAGVSDSGLEEVYDEAGLDADELLER